MNIIKIAAFAGGLLACASVAAQNSDVIVRTDAYRWQGDSIIQGEYKAWAVNPYEIHSTYHARPHYFMPVQNSWKLKNDLSAYPRLTTSNKLHQAIYNMGLDEMVNAVEPDTTLRTGKEWAGVWTRDVSYSIILSMAYMQPQAAMVSLLRKVNPEGQIIQDTGSGGAWPISTDRIVWVLAAWEIYKVTGQKAWLEKVYPICLRSLQKDEKTVMSRRGLVKGETSFIDWREQSYPVWMQTVDISQSEAMGTNVMYAAALDATSQMASILGRKREAAKLASESEALAKRINDTFWMDNKGYYGMYTYGPDNTLLNPRAETLGESLAILYDIAPAHRQRSISENNPQTPYGPAIFFPQIADKPNYHNNALWPFVASYWALAQAKAGNEQGVLEGIGSVFRPAALFATNKENFNLDNGDIFTELNSSNMLWSLSGNIALTTRILFGIHFEKDGLLIAPFVPKALSAERTLCNFPYRGAKLDITVKGYGAKVASISLDGKSLTPGEVIPASKLKGSCRIVVEMDCKPIPAMKLNRVANAKSPLMPVARLCNNPALDAPGVPANNMLEWNPVEYIARYQVLCDGKVVAETRQTNYAATQPGVWQVIGVDSNGIPSFASQPLSNRQAIIFEFTEENKIPVSSEISYRPAEEVKGFTGTGFAETDMRSGPEYLDINVPESGDYYLSVRYANGNGPVNTENKAAARSLSIDGVKLGTLVLPQRGTGNWNDWGMSNPIRVHLEKGEHKLGILYLPEDHNMNLTTNHALLDHIRMERIN